MLIKEVTALFKKELILEWRQKYALNGILLYVVSTVFISYLSFKSIDEITWNALYWIIMLFSAVNAVAKSFIQESSGRQLYYYTLASPEAIILSKMLYNTLLMLVLATLGYTVYSLVLGNPVGDQGLFIVNMLLGAVGFSACLTMVSAIASKAGNNATLMAILSFPVIIPILLMVIRVSKNAMDGIDRDLSMDKLLTLIAINAIVSVVSFMLFPYLWRS
ncbi:heme exporter protein CcmB [Penaeicola halotolerans]|uniref:heme exporter protein CcmB n=1 Tax=Penaeicola halotolerans TaxID=2793196 RepID=UPI003F68C6BF